MRKPPPPDHAQTLRGHAAMLGFSVLVSGSFVFGGMMANDIHPGALTALRFGMAAGLIGAVLVLFGPGIRRAHFAAPWRHALLGAVFGSYFVLMFLALQSATPVSTAAVYTLTPLMAVGFDLAINRRGTGARALAAIAIGALGAIWVIFRGDLASLRALDIGRGEAVFLLACALHAAYVALVARLGRGEPALSLTFGVLVAGALVLAAAFAPDIARTNWAAMPARVWWTLLYLVVFSTAISFFLLKYASVRLPGARVMAYTYLIPFWVALGQGAMGQGWPAGLTLLGGVPIAAALVILLMDQGQPRGKDRSTRANAPPGG